MSLIEATVTGIGSLIAEARRVLLGFGKTRYWFRGHAEAAWELVPSVHRHYDNIGERNLMGRFRLGAPTRYANSPELTDVASWVALMQHFGLPTRLLDWTSSLLTAAYFAVEFEKRPGPALIWALFPSELNNVSSYGKDSGFLLHGPEAKPLLSAAFDGTNCADDVIAVLPSETDMRMSLQQGAFTLHASGQPLEQRSGANRYLARFLIPETSRNEMVDELWVLGVRRSALFPDLANLAAELSSDSRLIPRQRL